MGPIPSQYNLRDAQRAPVTGVDMTSDTVEHVFEPFFTKEAGKGTGLGLPQVYGPISAADRFIRVESVIGVGTTF